VSNFFLLQKKNRSGDSDIFLDMPSAKKIRYWKKQLLSNPNANTDIFYKLGYAYENGLGATKNKIAAEFLYKQGIIRNISKCMIAYGDMLLSFSACRAMILYDKAWKNDKNIDAALRLMKCTSYSSKSPFSYISSIIEDELQNVNIMIRRIKEDIHGIFANVSSYQVTSFLKKDQLSYQIGFDLLEYYIKMDNDYANSLAYRVVIHFLAISQKMMEEESWDQDMLIDLFLKVNLSKTECSYGTYLLQHLLRENVNVMELHMRYAPGGDGFAAAKHDFFEKIKT